MSQINVITALYNTDLGLFEDSLDSLNKAARGLDVKHIIVDDGSTIYDRGHKDPGLSITIHGINNTKFIRLETNKGPGAARNEAFKYIDEDCKYICFLDSDDTLLSDSLKLRALALDVAIKLNPAVVAVYGNKQNKNIVDKDQDIYSQEIVPEFDRNLLMQYCFIPSNSIMFRKDVFMKYIGKLNENVRLAEDWLCWRQLSLLGHIIKIDVWIYTQVLHGKNLTMQPEVLKNHMKDILETQRDLQVWYDNLRKNNV